MDIETGFYYNRARYYSPELGRFLSADPIGYGDGLNMYAYAGNNPVNSRDPMGLSRIASNRMIYASDDSGSGGFGSSGLEIEEIIVTAGKLEKPGGYAWLGVPRYSQFIAGLNSWFDGAGGGRSGDNNNSTKNNTDKNNKQCPTDDPVIGKKFDELIDAVAAQRDNVDQRIWNVNNGTIDSAYENQNLGGFIFPYKDGFIVDNIINIRAADGLVPEPGFFNGSLSSTQDGSSALVIGIAPRSRVVLPNTDYFNKIAGAIKAPVFVFGRNGEAVRFDGNPGHSLKCN